MNDVKKTSKQESATPAAATPTPPEKFFWPPTIYTNLTKEYSLSRFPEFVGKYLLPSGIWPADQRDFNRRYGALFFAYNFDGSSWAPAAGLIFLLIVAVAELPIRFRSFWRWQQRCRLCARLSSICSSLALMPPISSSCSLALLSWICRSCLALML